VSKYSYDVQAGEAVADAAFDSFTTKAGAFVKEINSSDHLRGLFKTHQGSFRKLRHYGNPDDWAWTAAELRRAIKRNTNDPRHQYDWHRSDHASKTGKESEATGLSEVAGFGITSSQRAGTADSF
jgi:hypothetical protein